MYLKKEKITLKSEFRELSNEIPEKYPYLGFRYLIIPFTMEVFCARLTLPVWRRMMFVIFDFVLFFTIPIFIFCMSEETMGFIKKFRSFSLLVIEVIIIFGIFMSSVSVLHLKNLIKPKYDTSSKKFKLLYFEAFQAYLGMYLSVCVSLAHFGLHRILLNFCNEHRPESCCRLFWNEE